MTMCCGKTMRKNGLTSCGSPRLRCGVCGRSVVTTGNKPGRKLIGDHKISNAEAQRRYRERHKGKKKVKKTK
jgi:transposase-like protein